MPPSNLKNEKIEVKWLVPEFSFKALQIPIPASLASKEPYQLVIREYELHPTDKHPARKQDPNEVVEQETGASRRLIFLDVFETNMP